MKVVVTGAHGFIGRYVVSELMSRGHDVLSFDHHQHHALFRDYSLDRTDRHMEVFLGDVRDDVQVTEAFAHADAFIHLAAVLGTQETIRNPRPAALSNLMGGLNVLEAAAQYGLPGVYICVGNHWMNNTYSITKTMIERFVKMFNKERKTAINCVRVVNAYGPRQSVAAPFGTSKVRKITPAFVCRALSGQPIEVYGDGEQISDMVFVGDVARTLVASLEVAASGTVLDTVVEVGPIESHTVNEVAGLVASQAAMVTGADPVEVVHLPMRPGEVAGDIVTANSDTLNLVGIHPRELVSLERGMEMTIDWYADALGTHWQIPEA